MASSLQAAATLIPAKVGAPARTHLRSNSHLSKAFGFDNSTAGRLTCSINSDLRDIAQKCTDAAKLAGFALATSALVISGASAEGVPKRLTFDEIQSKTYMEVKGTGTANQCPTIEGGTESFAFKPGKYTMKKLCLEPTAFTVKAEGINKNSPPEFQKTKLMTRLTYTLDEIEGPFEVAPDGTVKFEEKDGFVPPITSPTVNNTWPVGSIQTVTWDTSDAPEQITNPIGRILLRHNDLSDTNHPIAEGFDILTGAINVTVPDVEPGDYQIVLFGDSGNFSPTFSIVSADTGNY